MNQACGGGPSELRISTQPKAAPFQKLAFDNVEAARERDDEDDDDHGAVLVDVSPDPYLELCRFPTLVLS